MEAVKTPNLKALSQDHENKWVALSPDYEQILATAETLRELQEELGGREAVVMRALPSDVGYVPSVRA